MRKNSSKEKYFITNGDQYLGCTTSHQFTIGVPVLKAKRFKKDIAEGLLPLIHENSHGEWCVQKIRNSSTGNNYVITNATKFVSDNGLVINDAIKAKSFKRASDAQGYINSHPELQIMMGQTIIVNDDYEPVDIFGRRINISRVAKQINIDRNANINKIRRAALSNDLRLSIYHRDNGTCQICGKPLDPDHFTVDHIVPLNRGGINDMSNYRCLCKRCNEWKDDSLDEELVTMMEEVNGNYLYKHPDSNMMNKFARMWLRGQLKEIRSHVGGG